MKKTVTITAGILLSLCLASSAFAGPAEQPGGPEAASEQPAPENASEQPEEDNTSDQTVHANTSGQPIDVVYDGAAAEETEDAAFDADAFIENVFTARDLKNTYDEATAVAITLNGDSAECADSSVTIDGGTVTISTEGTYVLSGTLSNGMILVNADKAAKIQLVLDNVDITNETGAAICILCADKVFVTMTDGSVNNLTNGGSFEEVNGSKVNAVIYSKEDLTINGTGSLTVTSTEGNGILSKDSLKITAGTISINAGKHGLKANDDICIANADITITAGKDGINCKNKDDASLGIVYIQSGKLYITAGDDGIQSTQDPIIESGDISFN